MTDSCLDKIGQYKIKIVEELRRIKNGSKNMRPNSRVVIEDVAMTKNQV